MLDVKGKGNEVDELVCFQEALPLFVIKLKDNGLVLAFLIPLLYVLFLVLIVCLFLFCGSFAHSHG